MFVSKFWNKQLTGVDQKGMYQGISSTLVWTQIFSNLKGSAQSYAYSGQYIPKFKYIKSVEAQLGKDLADRVFELFIKYERWKLSEGYYDLMDMVNYINQ